MRSLKVTFPEIRQIVAENDKQRFSLIPASSASSISTDPPANSNAATSMSIPADDAATASASPDLTGPINGESNTDVDPSDATQWLIRANQGHSIKLDAADLLTPISLDQPTNIPEVCVHGTTHKAWQAILQSGGLKPMTRNHVHFAAGLPAGFETLNKSDASDRQEPEKKAEPVISGMRNSSTVLVYVDVRKALEGEIKFWRSENGVILSEGNEKGIVPLEYFARVEDRRKGEVWVLDGKVVKE